MNEARENCTEFNAILDRPLIQGLEPRPFSVVAARDMTQERSIHTAS